MTVSDRERARIAADLHDGPIQDFAGVGYAFSAIASALPEQHRQLMTTVEDTVHRSVSSLRRMMVDFHLTWKPRNCPPRLPGSPCRCRNAASQSS